MQVLQGQAFGQQQFTAMPPEPKLSSGRRGGEKPPRLDSIAPFNLDLGLMRARMLLFIALVVLVAASPAMFGSSDAPKRQKEGSAVIEKYTSDGNDPVNDSLSLARLAKGIAACVAVLALQLCTLKAQLIDPRLASIALGAVVLTLSA